MPSSRIRAESGGSRTRRKAASQPGSISDINSGREGRPSKARLERRERIVTVALELLKESGFDNVEIREVSKNANVSLGTVYRNFPSKDLLLASAFERWCEGYREVLDRPAGRKSNNTSRLEELASRAVEAFEREPQFALLSSTLRTSTDPTVIASLDDTHAQSVELFTRSIDGLTEDVAEEIVDVVLTVLASKVMSWISGRILIDDVYRSVRGCVRLLLEFHDPSA